MTQFNLRVKIRVVRILFGGVGYSTRVLLSEQVVKEFEKLRKKSKVEHERFIAKLDRYARAGFDRFEGKKRPIRSEGDGVYRVGHTETLFRIIGFFEDDRRDSFVGIDAFRKVGTQLTAGQRDRIKNVARIKRLGTWRVE